MDKVYQPQLHEKKIYTLWEKGGYFTPKINKKKKPFTILLPLPNANDPMHMGHTLFTVQDIMIRYHRMRDEPTLWLPGGDHAGIETQYIFEKHLAKEGKSRFDFDRKTLYQMIADFVDQNKNLNQQQMRQLGFSLDWSRYHYSLEPEIVKKVFETFRRLHQNGLIYRAKRMVNYCPKCGTAFSDLEINHEERDDQLYFLNYGSIQIATTRPETIFADVAIAVHPGDKRYKKLIGQQAILPLVNKKIPIIADEAIKMDFGTGALKVTPAHDQIDYEIGLKHQLPIIETIGQNGRLINVPTKYLGLKVLAARQAIINDLQKAGLLVKTEPLTHTVNLCYKCGTTIEPMLLPQWYLKTKSLAKAAIRAVKTGQTTIIPKKRFEKMYFDWLENILDWNISRQIVWGPQVPVWYCLDCHPKIRITFINRQKKRVADSYQKIKNTYSLTEIKAGIQTILAPTQVGYQLEDKACAKCGGHNLVQDTDTFDTWFLSGQWPLTTLGYPDSKDFDYFYPTSVLDTMWDILFFWVARMMMLGLYRTGQVPFTTIHIHARVVDKDGKKMSKSKGNVINPMEMIEKYGADALRLSLVYGVSPASDITVYEDKIRSMRNFANKIWNASRFVLEYKNEVNTQQLAVNSQEDQQILKEMKQTVKKVTAYLDKYRFDLALETIYDFFWHSFCDRYIESAKTRRQEAQPVLEEVLKTSLKLLHPFMPFITETIWRQFKEQQPLIISKWPK
ncbi:MAG: valine--tRNA ligase [Candidatus Shapirobacteria bacterium]